MASPISAYYATYVGDFTQFEKFHNEVINMPRDHFSDTGLQKIRSIAAYLLLIEGDFDRKKGMDYKQVMGLIGDKIKQKIYPKNHRDTELENNYFIFNDLNSHYDIMGRMFRHKMGIVAFFGFIRSRSRQKKLVDFEKCREYYLSPDEILEPISRNNLISLNVNDNDFIKNLKGINIDKDTDYRPAFAILKYLKEIKRPATLFEISVLLGRIDGVKQESAILERALEIGRYLPATQQAQIELFFNDMNWKYSNNHLFVYASSQEPYFKFKTFILFMEQFGLISYNKNLNFITLTTYAEELLDAEISPLVADLEELIYLIESDERCEAELKDIIIYQRNNDLLELIRQSDEFIVSMNKRVLRRPAIYRNGKKVRNRLIAELAKIIVDYTCQACDRKTFLTKHGKYYCEAHHILEFSENTENGPDITDNMVVLSPEPHDQIHHGCTEAKEDMFRHLTSKGAITIKQFKSMIETYGCLTLEHVDILYNKKIISSIQKQELLRMLGQQ